MRIDDALVNFFLKYVAVIKACSRW